MEEFGHVTVPPLVHKGHDIGAGFLPRILIMHELLPEQRPIMLREAEKRLAVDHRLIDLERI